MSRTLSRLMLPTVAVGMLLFAWFVITPKAHAAVYTSAPPQSSSPYGVYPNCIAPAIGVESHAWWDEDAKPAAHHDANRNTDDTAPRHLHLAACVPNARNDGSVSVPQSPMHIVQRVMLFNNPSTISQTNVNFQGQVFYKVPVNLTCNSSVPSYTLVAGLSQCMWYVDVIADPSTATSGVDELRMQAQIPTLADLGTHTFTTLNFQVQTQGKSGTYRPANDPIGRAWYTGIDYINSYINYMDFFKPGQTNLSVPQVSGTITLKARFPDGSGSNGIWLDMNHHLDPTFWKTASAGQVSALGGGKMLWKGTANGNVNLNWDTTSVPDGRHVLYFQNQFKNGSGILAAAAAVNFDVCNHGSNCSGTTTPPPPPNNFNFVVSDNGDKAVVQGSTVDEAITANLSGGTSQAVTFGTTGTLPTGMHVTYSSASCNPTCSTTAHITTTSATPAGAYNISTTGTAAGITQSTSYTITVNPAPPAFGFNLNNPADKAVTQGGSSDNTITASISGGTAQPVTFSISGTLPAGMAATFSNNPCNATCSSTIHVTTTAATPAGDVTITVKAVGGGVTQTTNFILTVDSPTNTFAYNLTNDGNKSVSQGSNVDEPITATLTTGPASPITFSTTGSLPTGMGVTFAQGSCTPTCTNTAHITTTSATPAGNYKITASATGAGIADTTQFTITVNPPAGTFNFSLDNGGDRSVDAGSSISNVIAATLTAGTSQTVTLSPSNIVGLPTGASASFSVGSCKPSCTSNLTISVPSNANADDYPIDVSATGGGVTIITSFMLTVNPPTGNPTPTPTPTPKPTTTPKPPTPTPTPKADTTKPSTPSGLHATVDSATQISLSWSPSSDNVGVIGYKVFRDGVQIDTVTGLSYSDKHLTPSTAFSYSVQAFDASGNVSSQSTSSNGTTSSGNPDPTPSPTPTPTPLVTPTASPTPTPTPLPTQPATVIRYGTNVNIAGTIYYLDHNNTKRPYTSAGAFLSFGFNHWENVVAPTSDEQSLPTGAFVRPMDGSLINDNGTIYVITKGQRAGFTSPVVFLGMGYSWSNIIPGDTSFLPTLPPIDHFQAHVPGTLVLDKGTVYLLGVTGKMGIPSLTVFNSWGYSWASVVNANIFDNLLPMSAGVMPLRQNGALSPI